MYYVMEPDAGAAKQFIWFDKMTPKANGAPWRKGVAMTAVPGDTALESANPQRLPHADLALNRFDLHVYSPRLQATLAGVPNLERAPVVLRDTGASTERADYRLINVVGLIDAVDPARAAIQTDDDGDVQGLTRFALRDEQLRNAPPLFRLTTFKYYVIAHESVRAACLRDGITGVRFTPTTDYV